MNPMTNVKNIQKLNETELRTGSVGKKSWHDQYKDSAWIFVGGLPYDLTEGDILAVFSQYGEIVNINLIRHKDTGKSKGFCFLCFEDQRSTILSVDNLNSIKILGRTLRVDHVENYKIPKEHEDDDEETKLLRDKGCAPKVESSNTEEEEEEVLPVQVKQEKHKKKKKLKKHKSKKEKVKIKSEKHDSEPSEGEGHRSSNASPELVRVKTEKYDDGYEQNQSERRTESRRDERRSDQEGRKEYNNEDRYKQTDRKRDETKDNRNEYNNRSEYDYRDRSPRNISSRQFNDSDRDRGAYSENTRDNREGDGRYRRDCEVDSKRYKSDGYRSDDRRERDNSQRNNRSPNRNESYSKSGRPDNRDSNRDRYDQSTRER